MKTDIICNMKVNENEKSTGKVLFEGKYYYFCSPLCIAQFLSAPEYYIELFNSGKNNNSHKGSGVYTFKGGHHE
ncbi:MAG: hypothetical protein Kow00108_06830 [Calditrichia bacterium]